MTSPAEDILERLYRLIPGEGGAGSLLLGAAATEIERLREQVENLTAEVQRLGTRRD